MWQLAEKTLSSRLLLGTAQYPSFEVMQQAILGSQTEVITVALRRQLPKEKGGETFWNAIQKLNCHLLPNTAGCRNVNEAVVTAEMARELFNTHWIKLEVIGDDYNLQPDPFKLVEAAKILVEKGFEVFPYCTEDLVLCQQLVDCGCRILMPWGSPIGCGKGLLNPYGLEVLRKRLPHTTLIVDAGIGKPSHAAQAMELGFDGVLLNSAVSSSNNPILMAAAFGAAIHAGRSGYEAGLMPEKNRVQSSTPLLDTPFWIQEVVEEIPKTHSQGG